MKLLELNSRLAVRKALSGELHYSGDTNDSAAMNVWMQKQVMTELAGNGGKVPPALKDQASLRGERNVPRAARATCSGKYSTTVRQASASRVPTDR